MGEALQKNKKYSYEEFLEMTKDIERAEFIDGEIILQAAPTAEHQDIIGNIFFEMKKYFKDKKCRPRVAPFDIVLKKENEETKRVQPDISVICEEFDTTQNQFEGIPSLVVEVTSPSNAGYDTITKVDLYQRFGIPEYWLVSPKNKSVNVFVFNVETGVYDEAILYCKDDSVSSNLFNDLSMELKSIFD